MILIFVVDGILQYGMHPRRRITGAVTVKCFGKKQVYLAGMVLWAWVIY